MNGEFYRLAAIMRGSRKNSPDSVLGLRLLPAFSRYSVRQEIGDLQRDKMTLDSFRFGLEERDKLALTWPILVKVSQGQSNRYEAALN